MNSPVLGNLKASVIAVVAFTLLFGLVYPLAMTGISQVAFPGKADGDRSLIGQGFDRDPKYFQSRPSATNYSADVTYFNNLGPNSKALAHQFATRVSVYLSMEGPYNQGLTAGDIPADAVTTSASGVDPLISEANARIQAHRVAEVRGIRLDRVMGLIEEKTDGRDLGVLGEPGVNVLELNEAIDKEAAK